MSSQFILLCTLACFVECAFSQVISLGNNCGCQPNQAINLGNLGNLAFNNGGGLSLNNAASGICLNNGANGLNLGNAGLGLSLGNSLPGNCLSLGNLPSNGIGINNGGFNSAVIHGTSQQIGYGDVAIMGELPVSGPTAVSGNVPVVGYVMFEGNVPAGGLVSVVDPCGCGCN